MTRMGERLVKSMVSWDVTPYSLIAGYQHFEGTCYLHLCQIPITHWYPSMKLDGMTYEENFNINIDHHENLKCKGIGFVGIEEQD
jgi:hypothetical protein